MRLFFYILRQLRTSLTYFLCILFGSQVTANPCFDDWTDISKTDRYGRTADFTTWDSVTRLGIRERLRDLPAVETDWPYWNALAAIGVYPPLGLSSIPKAISIRNVEGRLSYARDRLSYGSIAPAHKPTTRKERQTHASVFLNGTHRRASYFVQRRNKLSIYNQFLYAGPDYTLEAPLKLIGHPQPRRQAKNNSHLLFAAKDSKGRFGFYSYRHTPHIGYVSIDGKSLPDYTELRITPLLNSETRLSPHFATSPDGRSLFYWSKGDQWWSLKRQNLEKKGHSVAASGEPEHVLTRKEPNSLLPTENGLLILSPEGKLSLTSPTGESQKIASGVMRNARSDTGFVAFDRKNNALFYLTARGITRFDVDTGVKETLPLAVKGRPSEVLLTPKGLVVVTTSQSPSDSGVYLYHSRLKKTFPLSEGRGPYDFRSESQNFSNGVKLSKDGSTLTYSELHQPKEDSLKGSTRTWFAVDLTRSEPSAPHELFQSHGRSWLYLDDQFQSGVLFTEIEKKGLLPHAREMNRRIRSPNGRSKKVPVPASERNFRAYYIGPAGAAHVGPDYKHTF